MPIPLNELKDLVATSGSRIKLDDAVTAELRALVSKLDESSFSTTAPQGATVNRIDAYGSALADMETICILLARWGDYDGHLLLEKVIQRLADQASATSGGIALWLKLRWYPVTRLLYASCIAALSARRFEVLRILTTPTLTSRGDVKPLSVVSGTSMSEAEAGWKQLPGHERHYTPHSEYLYKHLQNSFDGLLFLGRSYERLFDHFELLNTIYVSSSNGWAPIGRFGYKRERIEMLDQLVSDASAHGQGWPPLKAGLFNRSLDGFTKAAAEFKTELSQLRWH